MTNAADQSLHDANRRSWNAATVAHNSHKRDQAAGVLCIRRMILN